MNKKNTTQSTETLANIVMERDRCLAHKQLGRQTDRHTDAQTFPPSASQRSFQTTAHVEGHKCWLRDATMSSVRKGTEQLLAIVDN